MRLIERIGLVDLKVSDLSDTNSGPMDAETISAHDKVIDRVME